MKAIILSASTGSGHMSAARAINEYLMESGVQSEVIDTLKYISPILNKTVTEIYDFIAKYHPKIWKMMYDTSNKKTVNKLLLSVNNLVSKRLLPLLDDFEPDVIIATHPFAAEMISKLKSLQKIDIPLICVITDYAPHLTWINPGVDAYVVANSDMIEPMVQMGADKNDIFNFGIPVDKEFFSKKDKAKILEEIGLFPELPTVLIMSGGNGYANVEEIYRDLQKSDTDFQIILITGKNQKLYNRMQSLTEISNQEKQNLNLQKNFISKFGVPNVHLNGLNIIKKFVGDSSEEFLQTKPTKIIYFTSEVSKYMSAADLIITKPGGLTVSEALACGLPMALFGAIPGQEEENANFLVGNNMAVKLDQKSSNLKSIEALLKNPDRLNYMKFNCENFDKSDSLKNIYNLIKKLSKNSV